MPETTKAGWELAHRLNPAIGTTRAIAETCSLIHRHAVTYSHIQERWCNDEMSDKATARLEAREQKLEARIRDLVDRLPQPDTGAWRVVFDGDPRGNTVGIIAPEPYTRQCADNWDGERIGCDN